jgi:hypothetical protein
MMESPQIWHDASFEEVDALAGLAAKYGILALGRQTSDRLRLKLDSGLWRLSPDAVSMKYKQLASDS